MSVQLLCTTDSPLVYTVDVIVSTEQEALLIKSPGITDMVLLPSFRVFQLCIGILLEQQHHHLHVDSINCYTDVTTGNLLCTHINTITNLPILHYT